MKHNPFFLLIIFVVLLLGPATVFAGRASQTDKPVDPPPTPEKMETSENQLRQSGLVNRSVAISEENPPQSQPLPQRSEEGIEIRLQQAVFDPLVVPPAVPPTLTTTAVTPDLPDSDYYLVQFIGPIQTEWRAEVEELGGEVIDYVPDFAYIVKMDSVGATQVKELDVVRWVGLYQPAFRLSNQLLSSLSTAQADTSTELIVRSFVDEPAAKLSTQLEALGAVIQESGEESGGGVIFKVMVPETAVADIAHIKGVAWVEDYSQPHLVNEVARSSTAMNKDQIETVLGLYGEDQIVVVGDTGVSTGDPATVHLDLRGRVFGGTTGAGSTCGGWQDDHSHGTHVAGSVLGNGYHSGSTAATHSYAGTNAGIAPEALLYAWGFCDDFTGLPDTDPYNDYFSYMYNLDSRVRVNTNSWGYTASAGTYGTYDTFSRETDRFIRDNPDMVVLFAASNDGTDGNSDGVVDLDSMGVPAGSKNIITVGASENERTGNAFTWGSSWPTDYPVSPIFDDLVADNANGMVAFSSRGPVDDGRLKPDVIAPGSNIVSTRYEGSGTGWGVYDDHYLYMGGTSMATPLVAGASAIVREFYTDTYSINPSAALVKATLINGAYDIAPGQYGAGATQDVTRRPDNNQGWGRVDLANSLIYTGDDKLWYHEDAGLNTNGRYQMFLDVTNTTIPLRATLVWVDQPGLEAAHGAIINDLDLEIIAPDGTHYYGNDLLDGSLDDDIDHINNVEGIDLTAASGTYTVIVHGYNVPLGPQPFALVVTGDVTPATVGYLSGTVDDGSTPIANVTVSAVGSVTNATATDGSGAYLMALPAGNYDVTASAYGYNPSTVNNIVIVANATTTQDFHLTAAPSHTVSGIVTDATTGWPLYARIDISDYSGSPIWTDPETGSYNVTLLEGNTYDFTVSAWVDGYTDAVRSIGPLSTDITEDFSLAADMLACSAPGYEFSGILFEDSFDDIIIFPGGGWDKEVIVDTGSWGSPDWNTDTTANDPEAGNVGAPHSGSRLAVFNSYTADSGDQARLYRTSGLDLSSLSSAEVSFWVFHYQYYGGNDQVQLQVSTDGGNNWNDLGVAVSRDDGSTGWSQYTRDISAYTGPGMTDVRIAFLGESGWGNNLHIDDVLVNTNLVCSLVAGGLVVGNVYDENTLAGLDGVSVSNEDGYSTTSVATPDDLNVDDGFYTLFSPAGSKLFMASATNYTDDVDTVAVVANDTVKHDFFLGSGQLSYTPTAVNITIPAGTSINEPLTLTNDGSVASNFSLLELGTAVNMTIDDGSLDTNIGLEGSQFLWFNRFSPNPTAYPFQLSQISVMFQDSVAVGDTVELVVWEDADGNPDNGATLRYTENVQVLNNDGVSWNDFTLATPVLLNGPGDVLIGLVNRSSVSGVADYPAAIDQTASQGRSWFGSYGGNVPEPPTLPAPNNWDVIDDLVPALAGNWMIRGAGYQDVPWLSESPTSGVVPAMDSQIIDLTLDATVLSPGQYTTQLATYHDTPYTVANVPITLTVFTGYLWNGSVDTNWNAPSNWTPNGVPSTLDSAVIDPVNLTGASVWPVLNVNATIADLTVEAGAELTIPNGRSLTVNGALTNNGLLSQSIDNVSSATTFLGMGGYGGVEITPSGDMGMTTVEIRGNQDCTTDPTSQPVRRCFDITPATAQSATIRFYYLPSEANGNAENGIRVYHWNGGGWDLLAGTTHSSGADPRWVQVTGVSSYSPFVLDNGMPTAVSLAQFTSENSGTGTAVLLIISFVTFMLLSMMIVARRKR